MPALTAERINELLTYDPGTGVFRWKVERRRGRAVGSVAGSTDSYGYRQICIDGSKRLAHRVAWTLSSGKWPDGEIDHINGDRSDNRIANLREASRQVNTQNTRAARKDSKTGMTGTWTTPYGQHCARITVDGKEIYLGVFPSLEEAHAAYVTAKRQLHLGCTI
jgi:hypothetical protein